MTRWNLRYEKDSQMEDDIVPTILMFTLPCLGPPCSDAKKWRPKETLVPQPFQVSKAWLIQSEGDLALDWLDLWTWKTWLYPVTIVLSFGWLVCFLPTKENWGSAKCASPPWKHGFRFRPLLMQAKLVMCIYFSLALTLFNNNVYCITSFVMGN